MSLLTVPYSVPYSVPSCQKLLTVPTIDPIEAWHVDCSCHTSETSEAALAQFLPSFRVAAGFQHRREIPKVTSHIEISNILKHFESFCKCILNFILQFN